MLTSVVVEALPGPEVTNGQILLPLITLSRGK